MMPTSEETPLLRRPDNEAIYSRFSAAQKRFILFLISWSGLLTLFVTSSFVPSMKQIAADLGTTGDVISLTVSVSLLGWSIGNMEYATYSGFYGRRLVMLSALPVLFVASIGLGLAQTVPQLMIWRFIQAFGSSSGLSLGSGIIGDIYKMEERGTAMGIFFGAVLAGPAFAPFVAGVTAHYGSWRYMQYGLGVVALVLFMLVLLFFPETSHPGVLGKDKLYPTKHMDAHNDVPSTSIQRWKWVWLNPLSGLGLMRSPNILAVTVTCFFAQLTEFFLLVPIAYTIGTRYRIENEALIGLCIIPIGVGNMFGAPLSGWMSDRVVMQRRRSRGGEWVPEDRLRAALWGAGILVPCSTLLSGLVTQFVGGTPGLVINLFAFFMNGIGVDVVVSPCKSYGVDVMHSRSAEVIAASSGLRAIFLSMALPCIFPMINKFGVGMTDAVVAVAAFLGFILLWLTIKYGPQMRAWKDIGYSKIDNN